MKTKPDVKPYFLPIVLSVSLHVGVVILSLISWPSLSKPEPIAPHIQARVLDKDMLSQLIKPVDPTPASPPVSKISEPETTVETKPKQDPPIDKQRQEAERQEALRKQQKAEAEREKRAAIALQKKKAEEEKKRQLAEEKKAKQRAEKLAEEKAREKLAEEKVREKLAEEKVREKQRQEKLRAEEKKRQEEQRKREEKRLAEQKRLALEQRLKEEREKSRLDRIKQEELALQQQAAEFERALLAKAEAQDNAQRQQRELSEIEKFTLQIKFAVEQSWILPPGDNSGLKATLNLRLAPSGDLIEATVTKSSGNPAYDIALKSAAYNVNTYPVTKDSRLFYREFRNMYLNFSTE